MRNGRQRNRIDRVYHHRLEFRCPTVETVEWIVVQAQVLRRWDVCGNLTKQTAESFTADIATMDIETDDSSGKLVHNDHDRI